MSQNKNVNDIARQKAHNHALQQFAQLQAKQAAAQDQHQTTAKQQALKQAELRLQVQIEAQSSALVLIQAQVQDEAKKQIHLNTQQSAAQRARVNAEFNAQQQSKMKLQMKLEAQEKAKKQMEREVQQAAQQEAQQKAQQEARKKAQQEAQIKQMELKAQQKAQQEVQQKAQQEAQIKQMEQKAQQEAQQKARQKAQQEARQKAQQEAQIKQMEQKAQQEAKKQMEAQIKLEAQQEAQKQEQAIYAKQKTQFELKKQAYEKKQAEAQEQARKQAELRLQAQEQARKQAELRLQAQQESKLRLQADLELKKQAYEKRQAEAQEQARKQAELHLQAQLEAKKQAYEKRQAEAQEQARKQAELRLQAQEQARKQAELGLQAQEQTRKQAELHLQAQLEAKKQAYEKKQAEAQEQARKQAELRLQAQEQVKKQAELRLQAQEQARKQAELGLQAQEQARKQAELRLQAQLEAKKPAYEKKQVQVKTIENTISIDIFTSIFIENITNALAAILTDNGIKCNVYMRNLTNADIARCRKNPTHYLFIFCPQFILQSQKQTTYPSGLDPLPPNKYYLFQFEQLDTGNLKFMNPNIKNLIQQAKHTFDYSEINLPYYPAELRNKVSILPPPVVPMTNTPLIKKYDVLFFGTLTPRRARILAELKAAGFIVHTPPAYVFGINLTKLIQEARIVLNIHNGNSKALETCRLNEAVLSLNTHIISEKSSDPATQLYAKRVHFVETAAIVSTIKTILQNSPPIIPFPGVKMLEQITEAIQINILYSNIFHKYILGLRNPRENMITTNYTVIKKADISRKNICHIHCLHLLALDKMFGLYLTPIAEIFDIIVTYTNDDNTILNKYNNITFLKVRNYGMDIGPKFVIQDYLKTQNKDYNYIFFIHSKSTDSRRNDYFMPFINNLNMIKNNLTQDTVGCYFNNLIWLGDGGNSNKWTSNELYMDDIINYLNIVKYKNDKQFSEGNFYILHKKIVDVLFSDKLLYNILNTDTSFDYQWVKLYHNMNFSSIQSIYNNYKQHKLFGNNLETKKGHKGLADSMFEHVFERLPIILCKEYDININMFDLKNCRTIFSGSQYMNKKTKTLCIIACHTSTDLKIKTLKHNHSYFQEISDDLIYINSSEYRHLKLFENMLYIDNDYSVCYGKYLHTLLNTNLGEYDNIILTNDSFLITRSLSDFKAIFNPSIEMSALCCSNESIKHYPDFLRRYNKIGINKIIDFYKPIMNKNYSFSEIILEIEVKSHVIHNNSINVLYDAIPNYIGNIHFDNEKLKDYLYNKNYPIIKIKKMQFTTYNDKNLPNDFDPSEYKSLHPDLSEFNNTNATSHFIMSGINEGRPYKKDQKLIYSDFLMEYLKNIYL